MERLAENLIAAGAGAVLASRWPLNPARAREFAALFYQELADGVTLGEALRRARISMAQPRPDDASWLSFLLYGDPAQRLVTASTASKERAFDSGFDAVDDSQVMPTIFPNPNVLDRRFLKEVLGLALAEARRMRKDYLGTPHRRTRCARWASCPSRCAT